MSHEDIAVKSSILDHLDQSAVLLPGRVLDALRANDRAKVRRSVLQALVRAAASPGRQHGALDEEIARNNLEGAGLAQILASVRSLSATTLSAPGISRMISDLVGDVEQMLKPVMIAAVSEADHLAARLEAQRASLVLSADVLPVALVGAITSATGPLDSLHRLVMDLHKILNHLAAELAPETVDGAKVFGIEAEDRPRIARFMAGLEATRRLKFDHPGLETTAARAGGRLVIQNDIGTTDAHVLVINVTQESIAVTYTDVHRSRARFFVGLFDGFAAHWSGLDDGEAGTLSGEAFVLVTGQLIGADEPARLEFLEAIGAALVFLIDWNKARKVLRQFVDKDEAFGLLDWAARQRHGHRGFLEFGGADLVNGSVRRIAAGRLDYGVRLEDGLGRAGARSFLHCVLRLCAEGLLAGRAERLVRDNIDAELARHIEGAEAELLQGVVCQAGLARDIAAGLESSIAAILRGETTQAGPCADHAKRIEEKADALALALRADAQRFKAHDRVLALINIMEDCIDDLEEAAFLLSLMPAGLDMAALDLLHGLATLAITGTQHVARAADAVAMVPAGAQIDADDALEAIAGLVDVEHEANRCERLVLGAAMQACQPAFSFGMVEFARKVEQATDRLAWAGHHLRAHVLRELAG